MNQHFVDMETCIPLLLFRPANGNERMIKHGGPRAGQRSDWWARHGKSLGTAALGELLSVTPWIERSYRMQNQNVGGVILHTLLSRTLSFLGKLENLILRPFCESVNQLASDRALFRSRSGLTSDPAHRDRCSHGLAMSEPSQPEPWTDPRCKTGQCSLSLTYSRWP